MTEEIKLPTLRRHPESHIMDWTQAERRAIDDYARAAILADRESRAAQVSAEITNEDVMALYLAWDEEPGTSHASLIRAAYAQGVKTAIAQLQAPAQAQPQAELAMGHGLLRALRSADMALAAWENGYAFDAHGPGREAQRLVTDALAQPPVQAVREPLSDEQMKGVLHAECLRWREAAGIDTEGMKRDEALLHSLLPYARAVEAAHGIAAPTPGSEKP